jgi:hypothetical protein
MERVKDLILLVYTPREDSNARGYEAWLQEIDNPFFNDIPGIRHYTNWKTTSAADCAFPYSHFDFMFLDSPDCKDAVWGNQDLMAFAQGWTDQWGRYPDATPENMHMNYQVYLCSSAMGRNQVMSNDLSIAVSSELANTSDEHVFNVEESILGDIRFRSFAGELAAIRQRKRRRPRPHLTTALRMPLSSPRQINLESIIRKEISP